MRRLVLFIITVLALLLAAMPAPARAQVLVGMVVGVDSAPPPIPVYAQPPVPGPNYIWEPGYWAWGPAGYYWVPGTWVLPPAPGLLWTPGYWAFNEDNYVWHPGFWAAQTGFYGGIDYGYGYPGVGFVGGDWDDRVFRYNTAVTNVNTTIVHNVFIDRTVVVNDTAITRVSFNGGPNGIHLRPTFSDLIVKHFDRHYPPTAPQIQHQRMAATDRNLLAKVNDGRPALAAIQHPLSRAHLTKGFVALRPHDRIIRQRAVVGGLRSRALIYRQMARHTNSMRHQVAARRLHGATHTRLVRHQQVVAHPQIARYPYSVSHPQIARYQPDGSHVGVRHLQGTAHEQSGRRQHTNSRPPRRR